MGLGDLNLSPAARAVWEAFRQFDEAGMHVDYDVKIAAALRAAAYETDWESGDPKLLLEGIAAELEGGNG